MFFVTILSSFQIRKTFKQGKNKSLTGTRFSVTYAVTRNVVGRKERDEKLHNDYDMFYKVL